MVTCGLVGTNHTEEGDAFVLQLIKEHALGSVWVNPKAHHFEEILARGMHGGGVLTVGKHYPSPMERRGRAIDSHMAETKSYETKEQLITTILFRT